MEKFWSMNNNIYQDMSKEPQNTPEATKHLIQILDAIYNKTVLRDIAAHDYKQLGGQEQS